MVFKRWCGTGSMAFRTFALLDKADMAASTERRAGWGVGGWGATVEAAGGAAGEVWARARTAFSISGIQL